MQDSRGGLVQIRCVVSLMTLKVTTMIMMVIIIIIIIIIIIC